MKGSDQFKATIQKYLDDRGKQDELFAETLKKPNKNIDSCIDYIMGTVQKSGRNAFTDDEVYNMAVHYYDEDSIKPAKMIKSGTVAISHVGEAPAVGLTDEDRANAKQVAMERAIEEEKQKLKNRKQFKKTEIPAEKSLFD